MQKLHKYRTLFYGITLIIPQLLLGFIFNQVITDDISSEWDTLKNIWSLLLILSFIIMGLDLKQKIENWILPLVIIAGYLIGLFVFFSNNNLINTLSNVVTGRIDYKIIPLYLTIPGILYALIDLIIKKFNPTTHTSNLRNLGYAAITPIATYVVVVVILPSIKKMFFNDLTYSNVEFIRTIIVSIAATLFLFFAIRYIYGYFKKRKTKANNPVLVLTFGLILPFVGLAFNTNIQIFGNFNYPLIYGIVFLNATGLYLLSSPNHKIKLLGFILSSIGTPYVLYFFLVFIPYIPLALILLIALGLGLLMLTPIILFFIQLKALAISFNELKTIYGKNILILISFLAAIIIPTTIVIICQDHKNTISEIIDKTYHYDSDNLIYNDFNISKVSYIVKQMTVRNRHSSFLDSHQRMPLISIYYDWHVFNNLKLSNSKIKDFKKLFLGEEKRINNWQRRVAPTKLKDSLTYNHTTTYITEGDYYETQVDFEITNLEDKGLREFVTEFNLPEDVFITKYYLDIEDRREYGILAEKKAANWIYNQITNQRKDPGILQYISDKRLSLKIFPFKAHETRTSGFTIYHKNSVQLTLNKLTINIPVKARNQNVIEFSKNAFYISGLAKQKLPTSTLKAHYYFLVDNTRLGEDFRTNFKKDYDLFSKSNITNDILYVDADISWNDKPKTKASGFNYIKAVNQIQQLHRNKSEIPVIIVYANTANRFYADKNELYFQEAFPLKNLIEAHDWNKKPTNKFELVTLTIKGVDYHLPKNNIAQFINTQSIDKLKFNSNSNPFYSALQLRLFEKIGASNPKLKRDHWLKSLQQSFSLNILSKNTTYISLETEDQKKRLLKRQKEILNNKNSHNTPSEEVRMSEPYFWLLLIVLLLILWKPKRITKTTFK